LEATPGIDEIRVNRHPGAALNSQASSQLDYVIRFDGISESHAALNALIHQRIPAALAVTYRE
jgi:hypothetical protein